MTLGIRLGWMDQCGIFRLCPFLPIVHWDGMDSWDKCRMDGTAWDIPLMSIPSHSTLGWDGQLG